MDRVLDKAAVLDEVMANYNEAEVYGGSGYYSYDSMRHIYSVLTVPDIPRPFPARVIVMARLIDNYVVIDEDTTDRPLVTALVNAGISREEIVLLYAGEPLPEGLVHA